MPQIGERRGVIDVGSNSLLLVVAEWDGAEWRELIETSDVTGFGRGVRETGLLCELGISNCLVALNNAFAKAREFSVEPTAYGTMGLRLAKNASKFLKLASDAGMPVQILSSDEEARYGMLAVCGDPLFSSDSPLTIVDVGGHSTEIVCTIFNDVERRVVFEESFEVGTLGLTALSPEIDSPSGLDLFHGAVEIDEVFAKRRFQYEWGKVVALGASATNLVCIRDAILSWNPSRVHGTRLDLEEISKFAGKLGKMTLEERAKLPGLERGRERTIHIGALILERALYALNASECFVSTKGWRHAILARQ